MPEEEARGFLESTWKRRIRVLDRRTIRQDNAVEECCREGCSLEEVSEYDC